MGLFRENVLVGVDRVVGPVGVRCGVWPGKTAHHVHALGRFEGVTDWDNLGHGRGDVLHLPELDDERDDQGRQDPSRSEPADFGHGDSTGVQRL